MLPVTIVSISVCRITFEVAHVGRTPGDAVNQTVSGRPSISFSGVIG
jgi:hypothetical protein